MQYLADSGCLSTIGRIFEWPMLFSMSQLTANNPTQATLSAEALALLKRLIATPSFSREEAQTAALIEAFFQEKQIPYQRLKNNVWAQNHYFDPAKPTLLLNSHHDTVKPNH